MTGKVHRIGVISDTHGMLRAEVVDILKTCEVILHGGDFDRQEILDELRKIARVYAVQGNNDGDLAELLPETLSLELFGLRIFVIHDRKEITDPGVPEQHDLIVFGHSHLYEKRYEGTDGIADEESGHKEDACLWLNPGSCGPRRFRLPITMAVIEKEEGAAGFRVERIDLNHLTGM